MDISAQAEAVLQGLHTNAQWEFAGLFACLGSLGKAVGELEDLGGFPNGNGKQPYQERGWA